MDRYAAGDDAAFADVYDAVAPRLYAYLRRQTRNAARSEDLVQRTLLRMHCARGTFISGSAVLPWGFAIARRLLIDELRRNRRDVLSGAEVVLDDAEPESSDIAGDGLVEARDLARQIQKELARLPETQRTAFELMRFDGLSHVEAAEVLGTTVSAVKLRAHRAYVALRAVIGAAIEGEPVSENRQNTELSREA
jgi:RNA polymerase sigma-70 factor (ECF subfamily)